MVTLQQLHKSAWDLYGNAGDQQRSFLFDFQIADNGMTGLRSRPVGEESPLQSGQSYRLTCRFCPVRRIGRAAGQIIRKQYTVPAEEFPAWMCALLDRNGLASTPTDIHRILWQHFPFGRSKNQTMIATVFTEFTSTVKDESLAAHAWGHGLGKMKAFGCGSLFLKGV